MPQPSAHQFAIACGTAGAYVDVSTKIVDDGSIGRTWGRKTQFEDTPPGTFSFILDNRDGRFTPGNTAAVAAATSPTMALPLVEGMGVCWKIGNRLVAGNIRSFTPVFQNMRADSAQMRITCDDMLGNAGRHDLTNLTQDAILGSTAFLYWPFSDAAGTVYAQELSGNAQPVMGPYSEAFTSGTIQTSGVVPTFGIAGLPAVGLTQMQIPALAGAIKAGNYGTGPSVSPDGLSIPAVGKTINYLPGNFGCWSIWVTPLNNTSTVTIAFGPRSFDINFQIVNGGFYTCTYIGSPVVSTVPCAANIPHLLQATFANSGANNVVTFYIDGVTIGNLTFAGNFTNTTAQPRNVTIVAGSTVGDTLVNFSMLSHTQYMPMLLSAGPALEIDRIKLIDSTAPEVTIPSYPTDFSTALVGNSSISGGSTLDALNDVIRTEQGYIYTATTGTLTAPVQGVVVRARNRPASPTSATTFGVTTDIVGAPAFDRSITNTVSSETVSGPTQSVTAYDATLVPLVGSSTGSDRILSLNYIDLLSWAQDRIVRGKYTGVNITSFTVEAISTSVDRWADLVALKPGDRIQITGLPSTQLGISTFDGYLLGADETHSQETHAFTFYLAPASPRTAVYDTDRYMAGGDLSLSTSLTSGATTMSVATIGAKITTTGGDFPFDMLLDSERITLTGCTSATPQVATITRGVGGTTAVAHSSGAQVELFTPARYRF